MKRTEVTLSQADYSYLHQFIKSGKKGGKELERAYILLALHDKQPYRDIEVYCHANRPTIWRAAAGYKKGGWKKH